MVLAGLILTYLIHDINRTEKSLAQSLLEKPMKAAEDNLGSFFQPIESSLLTIRDQARLGVFDRINSESMNSFYGPIIENYPQVSSMGIAHTEGYEFDVLPADGGFDNREVWVDEWGMKEKWSHWENDLENGKTQLIRQWQDSLLNDPRNRPWFRGAMNAQEDDIHWTAPYLYVTTFEVGMTASLNWKSGSPDRTNILALDITLSDISDFTQQMNVSPNGKIFVLTEDGKYIGLPADPMFQDRENRQKSILASIDSINIPSIKDAFKTWLAFKDPGKSFEFESGGEFWWGKITNFPLTGGNQLIIGAIVPEKDILSEVKRTKRVIIGGFLFVLILTGFVLYSYGQSKKANRLLNLKNAEIEEQKLLIEEKNKEILDSINYAKRIQTAILPPDHEFEKWLPNSFVLYKPKDIVAGDFYWLEEKDGLILFAAADCTGHGVPGAMVSVVCKNGLSRSVREYRELEPGRILDKTRTIVIEEFEKSTDEVKDGMDIALCTLKNNQLKFAGAHNPLWIIRKGSDEIEEIKAAKQPIGKFDDAVPFTTNETELYPGDTFYLFSDGFADQFGGERGKKLKSSNFKKLLLSIKDEDMNTQKTKLNEAFENWKGDFEQLDDICIIGVRV